MNTHDPNVTASVDDISPTDAFAPDDRSLTEDVSALFEDGKTYLQSELQFQKTRASFVLDRGRSGAVYGIAAAAVVHLALVALVVGLVIALIPSIGAWAATFLVVGLLLVAGALLGMAAKRRFTRLRAAFKDTSA